MSRWSHGSLATCRIILTIIRCDCRFFIGRTWNLFFLLFIITYGSWQCLLTGRIKLKFRVLATKSLFRLYVQHKLVLKCQNFFAHARDTLARRFESNFISELIWRTERRKLISMIFGYFSDVLVFFLSLEAEKWAENPLWTQFKSKISIARTILESHLCWCC